MDVKTTTPNLGLTKFSRGHPVRDVDIAANMDIIDLAIRQSATIIVAAHDSLHPERADYVCDGTDDDVQIQSAIDALPSSGGTISFMGGNYSPNELILPDDNVLLRGSGTATVITPASNIFGCIRAVSKSNVRVSNLKISGANITSGNYGLVNIYDSDYCFVDHLVLSDIATHGIVASDDSKNVWIEHNIINSSATGSSYCGIRVCETDDAWVLYNTLSGIGGNIGICCPMRYTAAYNNINGCTHSRGAIWIGSFYRDSYDVDVSHNTLTDVYKGINLIGDGGNGFDLARVKLNKNDLNVTAWGIFCDYSGASTSVLTDIIFDGNILDGGATGTNGMILHTFPIASLNMRFNVIKNFSSNIINKDAGVVTTYCRNVGWATENSGTATLANGTTSIVVTHGLAVTPTAGDIVVAPIEAWGNMTQFYIDTYTSTQFTIHADTNPGQDVDFAWKAIVL
jgi:hypothetical protein